MENKPTLEEVKEYFKNAEKIKCLSDGEEVNLLSILRREIHLWCGAYWVDLDPIDNAKLWDYSKGYAEILTYKEKTFTITESQIKELIEKCPSSQCKEDYLKELFPEVFKSEIKLQIGKWYKSLDHPKWMFCVTDIIEKAKRVKGYGFGSNGLWMENISDETWEFYEFDRCIEVSESEILEALKNEAVKRGFIEGAHFINTIGQEVICEGEIKKCDSSPKGHFELDFGDGNGLIFDDGKWAYIILTITKAEAEKQLNKKIID